MPHTVNFRLLALILSTLAARSSSKRRIFVNAMNLLQSYAGNWYATSTRYVISLSSPYIHLYFLIRHFGLKEPDPAEEIRCLDGICCDRETGSVSILKKPSITFIEHRTWIAFTTTSEIVPFEEQSYSTAVLLSDSGFSLTITKYVWEESPIFSCRKTGFALFQLIIWLVLRQWGIKWNETLDKIDSILRNEVFHPCFLKEFTTYIPNNKIA
jgi:hypothetical protein